MTTLYNVTSSDGFIATKDESEDFIPDSMWPITLEVFKKYDVLVVGRKTYEAIQKYDQELLRPFEELTVKKVVITRDKNFQPKAGYEVSDSVDNTLKENANVLISSGPTLNNYLLENKLADKVIFHQLPISIGEGTLPFSEEHRKSLNLVSKEEKDGYKELIFEVVR